MMNPNLELLPSNELFMSILHLKQPVITIYINIPNNIISAIQDITRQLNNQSIDFKMLRKILHKEDSDVFQVGLKYINLSINYSLDLVQTLAIVNFPGDDSVYAASYLSLFIFLQFMSTKNFIDSKFTFIFQTLNKFAKVKDLRQIIISSFISLLDAYIDSNSDIFLDQIFQIMFDFYSKNPDLPKQSYLVLRKLAFKYYDKQEAEVTQQEVEFFSFIDMLAIERKHFFPNEVIETCVKCMSISLSQFELFSTTFFTHFTDRLSIKFCSSYFELFPLAISSFIMEKPPLTSIDMDSIIAPSDSTEIKFEKTLIKSEISKEIDFETSFVLPDQQPIKKFIQPTVNNRIDLIIKSSDQKPELIRVLIDHFTILLKKMLHSSYIFDLFAIVFEMTSHFSPVYDVSSLFNVICDSPIFDQKVNILNQSQTYQIISSFRAAAFDFCCRNDFLSDFINSSSKKPLILTEYVQRIIQSDFVIGEKQKTAIVKALINAELQFQKLPCDNRGVRIARASLFVLLSRFLTDESFSVMFFNDDWFCTVFILSFLFERSLRSFVISATRRNLVTDNAKRPKVVRNIANAVEIAAASLPSEESLDLISTIVAMLIDVASAKPSLIDALLVIREKIAKALSMLAKIINEMRNKKQTKSENSEGNDQNKNSIEENLNDKKLDQKNNENSEKNDQVSDDLVIVGNSEENDKNIDVRNTVLFKKSEDFFIKSIQFFTQISSSRQKTAESFVSAFESLGEALYDGSSIPSNYFDHIVQLISGSLTPCFGTSFLIREPKFVNFFLTFFRKSGAKFIDVLTFIQKLCEFSRMNCIVCHKDKVDTYLLRILVSMKSSYDAKSELDNETVDHVLTLLCTIVSVASSVSFVHQCFSLFTPIVSPDRVKSISLLQPKFITTISHIINKTGNIPSASFPLLSNGAKIKFTLDHSLVSKGFSFLFWLCLDSSSPQYMPSIFSISDNQGQKITVFLKSNNLMFQVKTRKTSSTGIFENCIPLRTWSFMNINFIKNVNSTVTDDVFILVNEKNIKDLHFPKINLGNGSVKFVVGGTFDNSIDTSSPALLATFGIFSQLEINEINFISELGPKLKEIPISMTKLSSIDVDQSSYETETEVENENEMSVNMNEEKSIDEKLLVMIRTSNLNNQMKLDFVPIDRSPTKNFGRIDMNSFSFIPSKVFMKQNSSFTTVLLSSVKVENLIPLFSQHDMKYVNGEPYSPQCEELALLVLGTVLASSIDAQRSMHECRGFDVICHLFSSSDSCHFTYKLYTKFFNLYQACSYVPLQNQIFHSILFNFDLLMKASAVDHLLILKHWNRSLFPAALSHKIERISFKDLIIGLDVYYWTVQPQYKCYQRNDNECKLDVVKCRKCIIDVAYQVAQYNFDDDDLSSMISFIVNLSDEDLLESMLTLLESLIMLNNNDSNNDNSRQNPIQKATVSKNDLCLIFYLLNHKEDSIIAHTIDLLILMIEQKVIVNISLPELVDIIIRQISPDFVSEILLQHIIALMIDRSFELFSICMFLAYTIGPQRLAKFIQSIQPSADFCSHFSWSFWPIVICFKLVENGEDELVLDEILTFLLECCCEQWINIIVMIDFIGQILSVSTCDMKKRVLNLLCNLVLQSKDPFESIKNYSTCCIQLAIRFLFFRGENEPNESLKELFNSSTFSMNNDKATKSMSMSELNTACQEPPSLSPNNKCSGISLTSLSMDALYNSDDFDEVKKQPTKEKERSINASKLYEAFLKMKRNRADLRFGLRIDKDGNWLDIDLAKNCINVFIRFASSLIANDPNHDLTNEPVTGPVLVMAAFMVRQDPNHISFIRPIVQLTTHVQNVEGNSDVLNPFESYVAYIEYSVKMTQSDTFYHVRNDNRSSINLASQTLEKLRHIELKDIVSDENKLPIQLGFFFESDWKKSISILASLHDEIVLKASLLARTYFAEVDAKRRENAKRWTRMWRSLALNERAPWNDGIDKRSVRFRRDFSGCYMTVPFKVKRDWMFDGFDGLMKSPKRRLVKLLEDANEDEESSKFANLKGLYQCEIIKVTGVLKGKLYVYQERLTFVSEDKVKDILLCDIRDVFLRSRAHISSAIEIFKTNGRSYFINFTTVTGLQFLSRLSKLPMPNLRIIQLDDTDNFFRTNSMTEKWVARKISNFEYLMHLNLMSGRSFNDLSQYPVFPWVVADYTSDSLDLSKSETFRDLAKPVGALNEEKLAKVKERAVQILECENRSYFYSSGFLYPDVVTDFLFKIEPFTSLQNNMRCMLQAFQSVPKIWEHIMSKVNDNWELIPEFYTTPEFLANVSNFLNSKTNQSNDEADPSKISINQSNNASNSNNVAEAQNNDVISPSKFSINQNNDVISPSKFSINQNNDASNPSKVSINQDNDASIPSKVSINQNNNASNSNNVVEAQNNDVVCPSKVSINQSNDVVSPSRVSMNQSNNASNSNNAAEAQNNDVVIPSKVSINQSKDVISPSRVLASQINDASSSNNVAGTQIISEARSFKAPANQSNPTARSSEATANQSSIITDSNSATSIQSTFSANSNEVLSKPGNYSPSQANLSVNCSPKTIKSLLLNDTILPPWADSPLDFVYKMRQALESEYVSEHLNEWIDLIWGVKQRNHEAFNVYNPESYSDIWKSADLSNDEELVKASLLNMGQIPSQLFTMPHLHRSPPLRASETWMSFGHQTEIENVTGAFFTSSPSKLTVFLLTPSLDKVHKVVITGKGIQKKAPTIKKRVSRHKSSFDIKSRFMQLFDVICTSKDIKRKFTQATLDQKPVFSFMPPSTIIFSAAGSSDVSLINASTGACSEISTPLSETSAIDSGANYFVIAGRNAVVNVYRSGCGGLEGSSLWQKFADSSIAEKSMSLSSLDLPEEAPAQHKSDNSSSRTPSSASVCHIASIASYRSRLPCVAISEEFNLIVNGTRDGFIVFSSLTSLAIERIVALDDGERPVLLSISPSWGFVVVHTFQIKSGIVTNFLVVFNVNGKLISRTKIDFQVNCLITFADSSSFDNIILADQTGTLYISDIYHLDLSKSVYRCHDKIVNIFYCNEDSRIVTVLANGKIFMIAHDFP